MVVLKLPISHISQNLNYYWDGYDMSFRQVVSNRVLCLNCNSLLESFSLDDVKLCKCDNRTYCKGGLVKPQHGGDDSSLVVDLKVTIDDYFQSIREVAFRYLKINPKSCQDIIRIKDMSTKLLIETIALLQERGFREKDNAHLNILIKEVEYRDKHK